MNSARYQGRPEVGCQSVRHNQTTMSVGTRTTAISTACAGRTRAVPSEMPRLRPYATGGGEALAFGINHPLGIHPVTSLAAATTHRGSLRQLLPNTGRVHRFQECPLHLLALRTHAPGHSIPRRRGVVQSLLGSFLP